MIRIRLKDKIEYSRLREGYLKRIASFVGFDEADFLDDKIKSSRQGKTKRTADELWKGYPELYKFLFKEDGFAVVNKENLKMLLAGPKDMPASFGGKGEGFRTMQDFLLWIKSQCMPKNMKEAKRICKSVFRYKNGFGKSEQAYWLLRNLKVRVCPYCNRTYTITLPSKEELEAGHKFKPTRPTFDHFYSQDECPYLTLSLFNLIPSCHTCNGNKKASRDKIVYPYDEAFGKKAVFRVIPKVDQILNEGGNPFAFLMGESDSYSIKFMGNKGISLLEDSPLSYRLSGIRNEDLRKRIENSIQLFCLEEQYNEHKTEIRDILKKRYYFNEQYVRNVLCPMIQEQMWKDGHGEISREQIMDIIFFSRIIPEEWGERPLSKLTSDILEQVSVESTI